MMLAAREFTRFPLPLVLRFILVPLRVLLASRCKSAHVHPAWLVRR